MHCNHSPPFMTMMFRSAFTLVALVGYASALLNQRQISGGCQNAVLNIVGNPDAATCLGASSLLALTSAVTTSSSLITPIDNWLTNICSAPQCSNATIAGVIQNITEGCASEFNITPSSALISTIEQFYPTVRQILCLEDGSTNCITQALNNIQATFGQLNVTGIINLVGEVNVSSFPSNITCTNCNKAIYNELRQSSVSLANDLGPALQSQCGASFIDGATPSGVTESASDSTETPASSSASSALGGVSLLSHGIFTGLAGLVVISALFTLLS